MPCPIYVQAHSHTPPFLNSLHFHLSSLSLAVHLHTTLLQIFNNAVMRISTTAMWQEFAKWKYTQEGLKYFTLMVLFTVFSINYRDTRRGVAYITSEEASTIAIFLFSVVLWSFSSYCKCFSFAPCFHFRHDFGTTNPPALIFQSSGLSSSTSFRRTWCG